MNKIFLPLLLVSMMLLAGCAQTQDDSEAESPDAIEQKAVKYVNAVPDGEYNFTGPYSRVLSPGDLEILPPVKFTIASDQDGEDIEMALWLPEGDGPFPVMLFSSPYFHEAGRVKADTGAPFVGRIGSDRTVDNPSSSVLNLIEQLVPHGYAFATHAVRGTAGSDGCNDLMGPKEIADIDQAVTWLGTQEWSNGNVAMTGVSYDGSTPWSAAATGNPHLKTIIPISGVPDIYGLMYRNGSSESRGPLLLNALYYEIGIESGDPEAYAQRILCPDAWTGVGLSGVAGVTGFDPTGYWQERNRKPLVEANYRGSVFSVQGLQDWNVDPSQVVPWVDELNKTGIKTKQLLGQWGHSWPDSIGTDPSNTDRYEAYRADYNEILLRWLDSELKGEDVDTGPAVQVRDNMGRWRNEDHYPPRDIQWTDWYLEAGGGMTQDPPAGGSKILTPVLGYFNPNVALVSEDAYPGWADFELPIHDEELLVVGTPRAHLSVIPHGPGGYMAAFLYAKDIGTGDMTRLGWTTMNLAYAHGGTDFRAVVPGMPLDVKMELQPMDAVVPEGSQLVMRVWVFTDGDRLPTIPPSTVELLYGESHLDLSTVDRDASFYFTPPTPVAADAEAEA